MGKVGFGEGIQDSFVIFQEGENTIPEIRIEDLKFFRLGEYIQEFGFHGVIPVVKASAGDDFRQPSKSVPPDLMQFYLHSLVFSEVLSTFVHQRLMTR